MRWNKNNGEELNDGILFYGKKETRRDPDTKEILKSTFKQSGRLCYKRKFYSNEDFKQYFGLNEQIDLKVKTYNRGITSSDIVNLDGKFFDVKKIDESIDKNYIFIYLQLRKEL